MTNPRYPEIGVRLTGGDGNALVIIGTVARALRRGEVPREEIAAFRGDATSGDYDHVLQTCMAWVDVT